MADWSIAGTLPASLSWRREEEVTILRLSRPEKRNAIDMETVAAIGGFFAHLPPGTKAVVIHGEGKHFSAGLDLTTLVETDATEGIQHSRTWHQAFEKIERGPVPVIAVLHGAVIGGGLELAAACHIRVAEPSAYYALPEGQRGIFVGGGGSVRVPRLVGLSRMQDMMLTGRTYGAKEGIALGFSQYLVEEGEGLARGIEVARQAAKTPPLTTFAVLQVLPHIVEADPTTGLLLESLMASIASGDQEAKTRLRDFLEKRAPKVVHH